MIDLGIFEVLVSFFIGFGVIYGFLLKSQIFGKEGNSASLLISIAIGLIIALSWSARTIIVSAINIFAVVIIFVFIAFLVANWLNLDTKIIIDIVKSPAFIVGSMTLISVVVIFYQLGIFSMLAHQVANRTGINLPSSEVNSPSDLANPLKIVMQPQIWGSLLILGALAFISYVLSPKKL